MLIIAPKFVILISDISDQLLDFLNENSLHLY